ncbi:hypothetical protein [Acidimangrovimonas pyrenivorans]|uniref:Uncharacterized protein n=1 Tax=Acidimangrovimonas pyrenivorans TaxID=2030798 RepID=A0ABV7AGB6_9RHOB
MPLTPKALAVALCAFLVPSALQAQAVLYTCHIRHPAPHSGIGKLIYVLHDPATGEARALDGMIKQYRGGDIPVKVLVDNSARTTYRWSIKRPKSENMSHGGIPLVTYTVTIMKASKAIHVSLNLSGWDNKPSANGHCETKLMKK